MPRFDLSLALFLPRHIGMVISMVKKFLIIIMLTVAANPVSYAQDTDVAAPIVPREPPELTVTQQAEALSRLEQYLKDLTTLQARFVQISSSEGLIEGTMYLARPGRMRLDYDAPSPVSLVADGRDLIFIDRDLQDTSAIDLQDTPARYLLSKSISLSDPELKATVAAGFGTLELTLADADDPGAGSLTLVFSDTPLELRQWRLIDAQGTEITVTLYNTEFDGYVDPGLFRADIFEN